VGRLIAWPPLTGGGLRRRPRCHGRAKPSHQSCSADVRGPRFPDARISVVRALHRHDVREFKSDRKEPHLGKRKLKRDS
jgi:hypothetical protein